MNWHVTFFSFVQFYIAKCHRFYCCYCCCCCSFSFSVLSYGLCMSVWMYICESAQWLNTDVCLKTFPHAFTYTFKHKPLASCYLRPINVLCAHSIVDCWCQNLWPSVYLCVRLESHLRTERNGTKQNVHRIAYTHTHMDWLWNEK